MQVLAAKMRMCALKPKTEGIRTTSARTPQNKGGISSPCWARKCSLLSACNTQRLVSLIASARSPQRSPAQCPSPLGKQVSSVLPDKQDLSKNIKNQFSLTAHRTDRLSPVFQFYRSSVVRLPSEFACASVLPENGLPVHFRSKMRSLVFVKIKSCCQKGLGGSSRLHTLRANACACAPLCW